MGQRTVSRQTMLVRVLAGLAGAILLVLLVGIGDRHVGISELGGEPGSAVLTMSVKSCNQHPRVEVDESASQVRLSAFIDRPGLLEGQDECLDQAKVAVFSPLGARTVSTHRATECSCAFPAPNS